MAVKRMRTEALFEGASVLDGPLFFGVVSLFLGIPWYGLYPYRARPPFPQSSVTSVTLAPVKGMYVSSNFDY